MRFIETPVFTALITGHLPDDAYRALQLALALRPEQGTSFLVVAGFESCDGGQQGVGNEAGCE